MKILDASDELAKRFATVRHQSEHICSFLELEDYSAQPAEFVSPPKWHLAHTTWFWEEFVLVPHCDDYKRFDGQFNYYWNSYYNTKGDRVQRDARGQLTRPTVKEIMTYRHAVDRAMHSFLEGRYGEEVNHLIEVGLQHEEQHQELLLYDIKYILGHQPSMPTYDNDYVSRAIVPGQDWWQIQEGIYEIGHHGEGFCFDNEQARHKIYLAQGRIHTQPVTNAEYLEFVKAGGYRHFEFWHDEGWRWVQDYRVISPLYWHIRDQEWFEFDLNGLLPLEDNRAVQHISFYEAAAFAAWKGMRLPTEAEWEVASSHLDYGYTWEWTSSAYTAYPGFKKAAGALGEYNGKFMVNQMVLRGSSLATPEGHSRPSYRNFFHPNMRWQYAGLRLAE